MIAVTCFRILVVEVIVEVVEVVEVLEVVIEEEVVVVVVFVVERRSHRTFMENCCKTPLFLNLKKGRWILVLDIGNLVVVLL